MNKIIELIKSRILRIKRIYIISYVYWSNSKSLSEVIIDKSISNIEDRPSR
jgi:hypothetical protein